MTKPEPSEVALRGCASGRAPRSLLWSKKSLKNSSKGDPGGNCGRLGPGRSGPGCSPERRREASGFTVWVVEMLTTDGSSLSAISANPSGAGRAAVGCNAAETAISKPAQASAAERRKLDDAQDTLINSSQQARKITAEAAAKPVPRANR